MNEKWQSKIEKQIQDLTVSIKEMVVIMNKHIEHSQEIQEVKFSQIEKTLNDHEDRIRNNTKFVYQAAAVISVTSVVIGYALRLVR